jgi:putative YhbY family RNA-binding protein
MITLTPVLRRAKRSAAHTLHPVAAIGQHGLTPAVLHEIDVALLAHELIKVRVFSDDRVAREALLARICDALGCAPVQHIGKLLVLWRPNPDRNERKQRAAKKPSAAAAPRKAPQPEAPRSRARTGSAKDAPAGKRAPAPRRHRGSAAEAPPVAEPRGDQARRRRRAAGT